MIPTVFIRAFAFCSMVNAVFAWGGEQAPMFDPHSKVPLADNPIIASLPATVEHLVIKEFSEDCVEIGIAGDGMAHTCLNHLTEHFLQDPIWKFETLGTYEFFFTRIRSLFICHRY